MTTTKKAQTNGVAEADPDKQLDAEIERLEAELRHTRARLFGLKLQRDARRQARPER